MCVSEKKWATFISTTNLQQPSEIKCHLDSQKPTSFDYFHIGNCKIISEQLVPARIFLSLHRKEGHKRFFMQG